MTLQEAINFFKSLKTGTTKKSEIAVCEKFIYTLSELQSRKFSKNEIESLEAELEIFSLKSNREDHIKGLKKSFRKFEIFLKDTFSLISKGYYTMRGIGLGSSFGILFGIVFLSSWERSSGIAMGLSLGMFIGLIIGQSMDIKAKNEGRVL